ncbi:uncharacterized protein MKZ38_007985 [Zalerion maritima]|uniref:Spindle assembly checkpoint component MAD1 n=1 Tax=Zalerion maritima TaxID=339359 RepID=A0AAD5RUF2_9PEZI|nr:uncharacterized protein MKZ38_007985 [Zalerion maritima]
MRPHRLFDDLAFKLLFPKLFTPRSTARNAITSHAYESVAQKPNPRAEPGVFVRIGAIMDTTARDGKPTLEELQWLPAAATRYAASQRVSPVIGKLAKMRSQTPKGQETATNRRSSLSKGFRSSTSSLPISRPQTSLRDSRVCQRLPLVSHFRQQILISATSEKQMSSLRGTSTQPTYNLFTGETSGQRTAPRPNAFSQSSRAVSHESTKENMAPPDAAEYEGQRRRIEELKAEIGTLKFSLNNLEQEKELREVQHEQEVRDVQTKRDDDFNKKQEMQAERDVALRKLESLQGELDNLRTGVSEDKTGLERKIRDAHEEVRLLQEQLEDLAASKDGAARMNERRSTETQAKIIALERRVQELELDSTTNGDAMEQAEEHLRERDSQIARLEADVLRLKAQTGDADTIAIIRKELSEQVQHIRSLEATNREQLSDLKHLRQVNKSIGILEEEKHSLQRKLAAAKGLERELDEAKIQRQRLEDERIAWTGYLESVTTDEDMQFDSPEAMAKALVSERLNSASLLEQQGTLQAEISERDSTITALMDEKRSLQEHISKAKSTATSSSADRAQVRSERQRALLSKEVEYLRAQLKAFETEDITFHSETHDEQKSQIIQELEELVDKYKEEVQTLQKDLSNVESSGSASAPQAVTGTKRPRTEDDEDDKQLGQLKRKNRKLQDDLSLVTTKHQLLEKELSVTQEQLHALKEQNKTRILSLRSNPTSNLEAIKMSTLEGLKKENKELLAHIQDPSNRGAFRTVPFSMLEAAQREIEEAHAETASAKKSIMRLKEVWSAKSAEFKEAIFSTLGWTVTFIPNGKMRVESVFYPSLTDEFENSIVFDGERGTMKISGGPRSAFAQRIAPQVKFWVREKNSIPGFLAALTLEFFDEHTRASSR